MIDPVLFDDWHPVAAADALTPGTILAAQLLEHDLIVWRSKDGTVHAWDDRCPHRGARLSLGRITEDRVVCAYHGWQFAPTGACVLQPAQPRDTQPKSACARSFHAQQAYGLVWVCLGNPVRDLPPFPEYAQATDTGLRTVLCGPYPVHACGPRIIENFLDMAHFGFIHEGILGEAGHAEVPDYKVGPFDDGQGEHGLQGVIATECFAYQPLASLAANEGSMVEYTYRVVRPLTAILTKLPQHGVTNDAHDAISLHVQPVDEEHCQAWIVLALKDVTSSDDELRAFQDRIFLQDLAVLESQRPKRIPLEVGVEIPQRADRLSAAYRRMLKSVGMKYGILIQES
ncbi:aromatic ring-hydroxylating dioxygenase subunit alpha [soil metagenome]